MLPQLSYVVAQAGVDARPLPPPPSMLPRLTKPFYAQGDSSRPDPLHSPSLHRPRLDVTTTPSPHYNTPLSHTSSTPVPTPYAYPSSLPHHATTSTSISTNTSSTYGPGYIPSQPKTSSPIVNSIYHPSYPPPPPPPLLPSSAASPSGTPTSTHHYYPPNDPWPATTNGSFVERGKPSEPDTYLRRPSRGFTVPDQTFPPPASTHTTTTSTTTATTTTTTTTTTTWHSNICDNNGGHTYPMVSEHPGRHEAAAAATTTTVAMAGSGAATSHCYTPSHRVEHLKEWNQILTWMEHQFHEQKEDAYQEKLTYLQEEMKSLQSDAHETYLELVADLNLKRETMIADAACFLKYQQEWAEHLYQEDIAVIEEEYNVERRHLHDAIIAVIEDRKKQIKEDKEHGLLNIKDLFSEAYSRVINKRTLRKRPGTESIRHDARKRQGRHTVSHQLESALGKEEDELDEEFMLMKEPHALATLS